MKKTIGKFFWNLYALCYDSLNELKPYREMLNKVIDEMNLNPGQKILDAGCGTGNFSQALQYRNKRDTDFLYGIDFSYSMLKKARKKFSREERRNVYAKANLNCPLPFINDSFNQIVAINTVYALNDPLKTIGEFSRVLKVGGLLIIVNPRKNPKLWHIFREHIRMVKNDGKSKLMPLVLGSVSIAPKLLLIILFNLIIKRRAAKKKYHFLNIDELKNLLERQGFKAINWKFTYGNTDILVSASKMISIINKTGDCFQLGLAQTSSDFAGMYNLRYNVYCKEISSLPANDYPHKEEKDKYDDYSIHFLLWRKNELIGTLRFIYDTPFGFLLEEEFTLPAEINNERNSALEISRWIISPKYRGTGIWFSLIEESVKWSAKKGFCYWMMAARENLWQGLKKRGWNVKIWGRYRLYHNTYVAPGIIQPPHSLLNPKNLGLKIHKL